LGRRRLGEFERLRAYLPALQRETCVSNHENLVRGVFGSNVCYNLITDQTDVTIQFDSTGENSEKSGSVLVSCLNKTDKESSRNQAVSEQNRRELEKSGSV
jgi:hypothetical protein